MAYGGDHALSISVEGNQSAVVLLGPEHKNMTQHAQEVSTLRASPVFAKSNSQKEGKHEPPFPMLAADT